MRRDEVIARLKAAEPDLRAHGVKRLYLFGSAARGEAGPDSDVDLFVDPDYGRFDFVALFRLEQTLSALLHRPVDLSTRKGLHPLMRSAIEREAVEVFG